MQRVRQKQLVLFEMFADFTQNLSEIFYNFFLKILKIFSKFLASSSKAPPVGLQVVSQVPLRFKNCP